MRIAYDKDTHGLFIRFGPGNYVESEEVSPGIVVDFDEAGNAIGLELEDVRGIVDEKMLERLTWPRIRSGADLRDFRERLGMTQEMLADLLEIPRNTIARWERDELAIEKLRLLELALASLINRAPKPRPDPIRPYRKTKMMKQTLTYSKKHPKAKAIEDGQPLHSKTKKSR